MKRIIYRIFDRYFRKKAIKNHRKMWRWLADNPTKDKLNYLVPLSGRELPLNSCYLCDYAIRAAGREGFAHRFMCQYCPLDWDGQECNEEYLSLFDKWVFETNLQKRSELALRIAELPERKVK